MASEQKKIYLSGEPKITIVEIGAGDTWAVEYGAKRLIQVNHDQHSWAGVDAVLVLARNLAKVLGVEVEERWEHPSW